MSKNKTLIIIFSVILIFCGVSYCDEKENGKLQIAVTNPFLTLLTSFIGGSDVQVIPIQIWNSNGDLMPNEKGKILRELSENTKIIALDKNDAVNTGLAKNPKSFDVKYLYSPFPLKLEDLFDPSIIPFVAQRILTALSEWDSQNYSHYQRRLAEFQARLSGAILVGQVLKDVAVCDLSGSCGILLRAAGCKVEKPDEEILKSWPKLKNYIDERISQSAVVIIDDDTTSAMKKNLMGRSGVFYWKRPALEIDYPTFLHEQYISLWQQITAKPKK